MTIGGLLLILIIVSIFANASVLLLKRKKNKKSIDEYSNYFVGSMMILVMTLAVLIITALDKYGHYIGAILNTKLL